MNNYNNSSLQEDYDKRFEEYIRKKEEEQKSNPLKSCIKENYMHMAIAIILFLIPTVAFICFKFWLLKIICLLFAVPMALYLFVKTISTIRDIGNLTSQNK